MGSGNGQIQAPTGVQGYANPQGNISVNPNAYLVNQRENAVSSGQMSPYSAMMQNHPVWGGLASVAMGMGQGMTKQPFLTDYLNNQSALQRQLIQQNYEQQTQAPLREAQAASYKAQANWLNKISGYDPNNPKVSGLSGEEWVNPMTGDKSTEGVPGAVQLKSLTKAGMTWQDTIADKAKLMQSYADLLKQTPAGIPILGWGRSPNRTALENAATSAALGGQKVSSGASGGISSSDLIKKWRKK